MESRDKETQYKREAMKITRKLDGEAGTPRMTAIQQRRTDNDTEAVSDTQEAYILSCYHPDPDITALT